MAEAERVVRGTGMISGVLIRLMETKAGYSDSAFCCMSGLGLAICCVSSVSAASANSRLKPEPHSAEW